MTEDETVRLKAKGRVKLLIWILVLGITAGGAAEYRRMATAPAMAVLVYQRGAAANANVMPAGDAAVAQEPGNGDAAVAQEPGNGDALEALLAYMRDVREMADNVSEPVGVLDKIRQTEAQVSERPLAAEKFEEGKIEVYDSARGVIDVIEVSEKTTAKTMAHELGTDLNPATEAGRDKAAVEKDNSAAVQAAKAAVEKDGAVNLLPAAVTGAVEKKENSTTGNELKDNGAANGSRSGAGAAVQAAKAAVEKDNSAAVQAAKAAVEKDNSAAVQAAKAAVEKVLAKDENLSAAGLVKKPAAMEIPVMATRQAKQETAVQEGKGNISDAALPPVGKNGDGESGLKPENDTDIIDNTQKKDKNVLSEPAQGDAVNLLETISGIK